MNLNSLTPEQRERLLKAAGGQLGMSPEALKNQLESGQLDALLSRLSPEQSGQIGALLKNPAAVSQLLQNPQVAELLKKFMKGI
jgi:hypothetical protein